MAVPNAKDRPLNKEIVLSLNAQVCGSKLPKTLKNNNKQNQREIRGGSRGTANYCVGEYHLTLLVAIFLQRKHVYFIIF